MIERHPFLTFLSHLILIFGIIIFVLPIYIAFVASTHSNEALMQSPIPIFPGRHLWEVYKTVLLHGVSAAGTDAIAPMLWRSFIMALLIATGKIIVSILSAYAVVYFHFPLRKFCFWLIFLTLMLPVEVRILPTFEIVARMNLLNSYAGLTLPLIASATATFLFRQFFLTIPEQLTEAAKLDGAGPLRFLWDIVLPLSKTNIAALFIIMFIYGWNQYLWPLVVTTRSDMSTIVMGMQQLANVADQVPQWNAIMAMAILATLPPILVVVCMQRLFEKGLMVTEK